MTNPNEGIAVAPGQSPDNTQMTDAQAAQLTTDQAAMTAQANTPQQLAAAALAAGIAITSTGTPALNGTYPLDQDSQNNVNATVAYILLNGTFPEGGTTMPWLLKNGTSVLWPSVTEFKAFATAYANYVAEIVLYEESGGQSGSLSSSSVTIP
jgi:hypothetical protein